MKDAKAAIILLNYLSWQETLRLISVLEQQIPAEERTLIVVDNASPNESGKRLAEAAEGRYHFIASERNGGYASGNNLGLRQAYALGCDYAWIMNNDIELTDAKRTLDALIRVLVRDSRVAVVNPDIIDGNGHPYNRDVVRPSFYDLTFGIGAYRKKGRACQDLGGYAYVYRPQGCCMLLDLKRAAEVDFLDEHTFLYMEEVILAERLGRAGYRCACCTSERVVHHNGVTIRSSKGARQIRRIRAASFRYYLEAYREFTPLQRWLCCRCDGIKSWAMDIARRMKTG